LGNLGAVVAHTLNATSHEGFNAAWRVITVLTVDGDLIDHVELFDEEDLDNALAKFDELNQHVTQLENDATRARARGADAYNRRDVEGFLALASGRYEDRRKGLRDEGAADRKFARAVLSETPTSWRLEVEPVAIRGDRLALTRETFRDTAETTRPITVELMTLTEVADNELDSYTIFFDPDDINEAVAELTARWIASGEVAHPEVIEAYTQILQTLNRHDWDVYAASLVDATYANHRQLGTGETIPDFITSVSTIASLIPDVRVEPTEIFNYSASGAVGDILAKGTSSDGVEVEIPMVFLGLFDGDRLTHFELFDAHDRDLALARFDELTRSGR
jgi:hypothetical protein